MRGRKFRALRHAKREAKKKRIAETPENGDNDEGVVVVAAEDLLSVKGEGDFESSSDFNMFR